MTITEFSLPQRYKTNRKGPVRWILSHIRQNWHLGVAASLGAIS